MSRFEALLRLPLRGKIRPNVRHRRPDSWFRHPEHRGGALSGDQVYALRTNNPAFAHQDRQWLDRITAEVERTRQKTIAELRGIASEKHLPLFFGKTTPEEIGRLLEGIEQGTVASTEACNEM